MCCLWFEAARPDAVAGIYGTAKASIVDCPLEFLLAPKQAGLPTKARI
jgi:hypothetical protein